jgi:hypothetical protein
MDERLVSELEAAIADSGALLVRLQKYRQARDPESAALVRDALALGDEARRLHRRGALDEAAARRLLAHARGLVAHLGARLAAIRDATAYRAAVAALATGDQATLARRLPEIFVGVEATAEPPDLFVPVPWRHRGRPRPPAEVAAEVARLAEDGLPAEGDDLAPGTDPALPAVVLHDTPPADEPVLFRLAPAALPLPVYRLAETGEYLVYAPSLRAPLVVRIAARPPDQQERLEFDFAAYRDELAAALTAAGVRVESA